LDGVFCSLAALWYPVVVVVLFFVTVFTVFAGCTFKQLAGVIVCCFLAENATSSAMNTPFLDEVSLVLLNWETYINPTVQGNTSSLWLYFRDNVYVLNIVHKLSYGIRINGLSISNISRRSTVE
jgi:hypothetical protein